MSLTQSIQDQTQTRQALLEAAAEVFARVGYRAATVREICINAGVNIAAVNYHFGDKANLYREVFRYTHREAQSQFPAHLAESAEASPEARLRSFIEAMVQRIFADGVVAWHGRLMSREMIEPSDALDEIVEEGIRPQTMILSAIMRDLIGAEASLEDVRLFSCSVASQCLFYHHCRPVLERLFPGSFEGTAQVDRLANHITEFSLAAIRQKSGTRV